MLEREFNLLDEPWIRVITQDCREQMVSLTEALLHAHEYRDLAGEMAAQDVAVLRLMIAIVHTVFSGSADEDNEDAWMDVWEELWKQKHLPEEPIISYTKTWHERFWLFHPERPFYQVPTADNGTPNNVAKLNGAVSESNNKLRLFSMIANEGKTKMSYPEAARWLLFLNGFDDCAAKQRDKSDGSRSMTTGWLGKLGLVTAVGSTLFESILLNMVMLTNDHEQWPEQDMPIWETEQVRSRERVAIAMPENLAALYTLQSRRLLLRREADIVTGYYVLGGDAFEEINALNEPMTLWRFKEDSKTKVSGLFPKKHERSRQIWREFGSIVEQGEAKQRPGVVTWVDILRRNRVMEQQTVTFRSVCVRYDSSQSSSITDAFSDSLSFHADLLNELGRAWRETVMSQISLIDDAAKAAGDLAANLAKAVNQSADAQRAQSDLAKSLFYDSIDEPFRNWLVSLKPDQDAETKADSVRQWSKCARNLVLEIGEQLVREKGDVAFIGRTVKDDKKKTQYHYSAPEAFGYFNRRVWSIYPHSEKEGEDPVGNSIENPGGLPANTSRDYSDSSR